MVARHLSIAIGRSAHEVYDFASRPQNLALWASGLGQIRQSGNEWVAQNTGGDMRLRFAERNDYGVLDHWVTTPDGTNIYVPLRVVGCENNGQNNGEDGCEVVLTLFRQPDMTDAKFDEDANWVLRDLAALKQLMEAT
jgi:hypothetical protein